MQRQVTVKHLLTHTSGLPDQLPQNAELRSKHAGLSEFVKVTLHVSHSFLPQESAMNTQVWRSCWRRR